MFKRIIVALEFRNLIEQKKLDELTDIKLYLKEINKNLALLNAIQENK